MGVSSTMTKAWLFVALAGMVLAWSTPAPQAAMSLPSAGTGLQASDREVPASGVAQAVEVQAKPHVKTKPRKVDRPHRYLNPSAMAKAKAAASNRAAASHQAATLAPTAVLGPSNPSSGGLFDYNSSPSDSTGDISPNNYVEVVNSQIGVYDRGLVQLATAPLADFAGFSSFDCVFDPQIAWDNQAKRWLYAMADQVDDVHFSDCNHTEFDFLLFGWTTTSDPLGTWCAFYLPTGTALDDYPKLGHDNNFMTIGANVFAGHGTGAFGGAIIWAIKKPAAGSTACTPPTATYFGGATSGPGALTNSDTTLAFTPVPADTTDGYSYGYIVAAPDVTSGPATKLTMWHLSSSSGTPILFKDADVTVASFQLPPSVPQPSTGASSCGTSGTCLDSLDGRLTQAVAHYDPKAGFETVWTQHAINDPAVGALSVERWYELIPGHTAPFQTGTISDPNLYIFNGAVSPAGAGNEAVVFYNAGSSAANGFASYRAQSRNSLAPLGTMSNEIVIQQISFNDADFTCGVTQPIPTAAPCRWGDYSSARPDPASTNAVWGAGMLVNGSGGNSTRAGWMTWIARMTPGCSDAWVSSASPQVGDLVHFTATSAGCSNPVYQFYLRGPNGTWILKRPFSSSDTWIWDTLGSPVGFMGSPYDVQVWANQAGDSTGSYEATASAGAGLAPANPCQVVFLDVADAGGSGILPGATVDVTASVSLNPTYCSTPLYAFWLRGSTGSWTLKRSYGLDPTWKWDTAGLPPGFYSIQVWAKQRGDSPAAGWEARSTSVEFIIGCTTASISPPAPVQAAGSTVALTAGSANCPNPHYAFWIKSLSGTWYLKRPFSTDPAFAWNSAGFPPGSFVVRVWANQEPSSTRYDTFAEATVTLTGCTAATLAPPSGSASVATPVQFTATSSGCDTPLFEFWVKDTVGKWHRMTDFGGSTWTWTHVGWAKGVYHVRVWANQQGAYTGTYETFADSTFTLS